LPARRANACVFDRQRGRPEVGRSETSARTSHNRGLDSNGNDVPNSPRAAALVDALRSLGSRVVRHLPLSKVSVCKPGARYVQRMHSQTAPHLQDCAVLDHDASPRLLARPPLLSEPPNMGRTGARQAPVRRSSGLPAPHEDPSSRGRCQRLCLARGNSALFSTSLGEDLDQCRVWPHCGSMVQAVTGPGLRSVQWLIFGFSLPGKRTSTSRAILIF